jgi:hypothetical protein
MQIDLVLQRGKQLNLLILVEIDQGWSCLYILNSITKENQKKRAAKIMFIKETKSVACINNTMFFYGSGIIGNIDIALTFCL